MLVELDDVIKFILKKWEYIDDGGNFYLLTLDLREEFEEKYEIMMKPIRRERAERLEKLEQEKKKEVGEKTTIEIYNYDAEYLQKRLEDNNRLLRDSAYKFTMADLIHNIICREAEKKNED